MLVCYYFAKNNCKTRVFLNMLDADNTFKSCHATDLSSAIESMEILFTYPSLFSQWYNDLSS